MKPLCTSLFIVIGGSAVGQPTYIRTYAAIPYAWGMATRSGGLVVAGNYSDEEGYLLHLDRDGDVSWMKRYTGLCNPGGGSDLVPCVLNRFYALTVAADGKLVVVGSVNGALSDQRSISCYDSLGTWLWGQTSGTEMHGESLSLAAAGNDSTFIVAGDSPDLMLNHATLFRYAVGTGECLGGVKMLGGIGTRAIGIDFDADGNVLMTTGAHGDQLMKLTPELAPIWRLSWANFSPTVLKGGSNGMTVAASDTVIAMINPAGTLAWINELALEGGIRDIAVHPDGRILALGTNGSAYSWLTELDSTGAIQWVRRFGNDGEGLSLTDLELLPDGSAFLVGYHTVTDALCVVSVDQNGELADCSFPPLSADVVPFASIPSDTLPTFYWSPGDPGILQEVDSAASISAQIACGAVGYGQSEDPSTTALDVVPNPMNETARVLFSEALPSDARIELMDVNGRVVRTIRGNGSRELILEQGHLAGGIYVLRMVRDSEPIRSTRLVIR